jgi:hypothetical protein
LAFIKAHLCRRRLSYLTRSPGHAGAGSARSRAISDHMDYGARAAAYVDAFMAAINWPNAVYSGFS